MLLCALACAFALASSDSTPRLREADRVRIAEAFRLAGEVGDSVWGGWREAPFAVLLVTPETEFLVRHPRPSSDFADVGYDSLLSSEVYARPRQFAPNLLATFPAVGGVSTIVVGQPERTGKSSTAWVLTLLHEHFHQLQASRPDYYARVAALDLARGDSTGMWMLNFAFPYDSAAVQRRFDAARAALHAELAAGGGRSAASLAALDSLRAALDPADWRYLAFQMWQEGVARWTEYAVARVASEVYTPSTAFQRLPDYHPFRADAAALRRGILDADSTTLGASRRVAFYPFGAATALLLDAARPDWRARYFTTPFALDSLLR